MKKTLVLFFFVVILGCQQKKEKDLNYVLENFKIHTKTISKIEYQAQRIDTFGQGAIRSNKGYALIEIRPADSIMGFSFFAERFGLPEQYIYDHGRSFEISIDSKNYEMKNNGEYLLGSPGGQMIPLNLFHLDSLYNSLELQERQKSYILKYEFDEDTIYELTNRIKIIELDKNSFIPIRVTSSYNTLGLKSVHEISLRDIKINNEVSNSIQGYKDVLSEYELIKSIPKDHSEILNQKMAFISFPNLLNNIEVEIVNPEKLTLIDFWEVWCGPCVKSLPEVQRLKNKYIKKLQVVGILTEDKFQAIKLIKKKNISFPNLIGTKELLKKYYVDSYPRYFLVDSNGIIRKEYYGFSNQIEEDIKAMISE